MFAAYGIREYASMSPIEIFFKIGGPLLVGILSIAALVLTHKNDVRVAMDTIEKENQLRSHISSLETELAAEAKVIRNLTVLANIHFSGDWDEKDLPFSDQLYIALPEHTRFVLGLGNIAQQLNFYGTKMYRFIETPGGHRVFAVEAAIRIGSWPIGQSINVLESIKSAIVTMPFLAPSKLKKPTIRIHSASVQFTFNDRLTKQFKWEESDVQRKNHTFLPPTPDIDTRLVYIDLTDPDGLKNWNPR